jgi:hypothetical protein
MTEVIEYVPEVIFDYRIWVEPRPGFEQGGFGASVLNQWHLSGELQVRLD